MVCVCVCVLVSDPRYVHLVHTLFNILSNSKTQSISFLCDRNNRHLLMHIDESFYSMIGILHNIFEAKK